MVPSTIGPYRIIRQLGEGGMGVVYEAMQPNIERRVAIKVLHPDCAKDPAVTSRFFNEARAVNLIEHPGLVAISDYAQLPDGSAYIVMEYLRGESLGARMRHGPLPLGLALNVAWQITDALSAVHAKAIVHRDLKPDNVMLVTDTVAPGGARVKLLDFGIAKLAEVAKGSQVSTRTDQLLGTPRYMSPEQCRGAREIDEKSDVYSLGVMLYQILGGRPPFEGAGAGEVIAMHIYEAPRPLGELTPDLPPELVSLVHRMLAKDKQQRPSMRELFEQLGPLVARHGQSQVAPALAQPPAASVEQPQQAPAPQVNTTLGNVPGQSIAENVPRRRILVAGGLLGLVVAGAVFLSRFSTGSRPEPMSAATAPTAAGKAGSAQKTVTWRIDSEPQGAAITRVRDGALLGKTPWQDAQPAAPDAEELRLSLAGYQVRTITLSHGADSERREQLEREGKRVDEKTTASATKPARPPTKTPARRKPPNAPNGYEQRHGHGPVQLEE